MNVRFLGEPTRLAGAPRAFSFANLQFIGSDCVLMQTALLGGAKAGDIFVTEEPGITDQPAHFNFYLIRRVQDAVDNRGIADDHVAVLLKLIYQTD